MTRNKKILIGVGVVVILGALAFANFKFKRQDGTSSTSRRSSSAISRPSCPPPERFSPNGW